MSNMKEYPFSFLKWEDVPNKKRKYEVISLLQNGHDEAAIQLLPKLNKVEAENVFEKEAPRILRILVLRDTYLQNARELWTDMKHVVLKNESIFCGVLHELWRLVFDPAQDRSYLSNCQGDQVNDFLLEIWSNAPDDLKAAVSDQCISKFFSRLSDDTNRLDCYYGHEMTFALEMLKRSRNVNKEEAWRTYWRKFTMRAKPSCLQEFIKLCLPNDEAVIELFKIDMLDFTDLFSELIRKGLYPQLKDYLKFCTKDAKRLQSVSVEMLRTNLIYIWEHEDDKFAKFNQFCAELSSMVKMDVDELKAEIISSTERLEFLIRKAFLSDSKVYMRSMDRLITSAQQLKLIKRKFLDLCPDFLINGKCEFITMNHKWPWFLDWCAGSREGIAAFKRSLNMDVIFLRRLEDNDDVFVHSTKRFHVLLFLDQFLKWYFGNEEGVKNFKLEKVKNYIEILRFKMKINPRYKDGVTSVFMWFFDNNMETVRAFCKTYHFIFRSSDNLFLPE